MEFLKGIGEFFLKILSFTIKVFIVLFMIAIFISAFSVGELTTTKSPNLAEIKLEGAIMDELEILKEIENIANNQNIKGVLLNIDSPGGALSPSVEISEAIKELNFKKPVIAYASGTMASGSYLSGVWATKIYANKGAFIGSIGVIMQGMNISELNKKIGISTQTIKAGEYKEAGTMTREWTPEEKQSLQFLTDQSYALFTNEVANARKLDINNHKNWANARVFIASDAINAGLIDGISTYSKVKDEVAKAAKVSEQIWKQKSKYDKFVDSMSTKIASLIMAEFSLKVR